MSHTLRHALTVTALLSLALGGLFWSQAHSAAAQDEIFSGPQVGEPTPGFTIIGSSGPYKDQSVDIIEEFAGGPSAIVFVNRPTRAAARTLRELDKGFAARFDQGLQAMFVLLSADQEQSERYGGQLLRSLNMRSEMGVSVDGLEGPGSYGLLKESMLTILIAKDNVVTTRCSRRTCPRPRACGRSSSACARRWPSCAAAARRPLPAASEWATAWPAE
jgi:hypothetical protein